MIIITAADKRFSRIAESWKSKVQAHGYEYRIYDLGGLGYGIPGFAVPNSKLQMLGRYNDADGAWASTGWHKPKIILDALEKTGDNILYLDADAVPACRFSVDFTKWDVGVVKRESNNDIHKLPEKIARRGKYNAGVLFFTNNNLTRAFVKKWFEYMWSMPESERNDQLALNQCLDRIAVMVHVFGTEWNTNKKSKETIIYHESGRLKNGIAYRPKSY